MPAPEAVRVRSNSRNGASSFDAGDDAAKEERHQNCAGFPWPKPKRRSKERDKAIATAERTDRLAARPVCRPVAASQRAESQGPEPAGVRSLWSVERARRGRPDAVLGPAVCRQQPGRDSVSQPCTVFRQSYPAPTTRRRHSPPPLSIVTGHTSTAAGKQSAKRCRSIGSGRLID
jgi:hypothetical protein